MTASVPRRDNGLHAGSYVRLLEVDAHLVDGLLERLRDVHVAAYTTPSGGRRGPYGETLPPSGPAAAVWVDSDRHEVARATAESYLHSAAEELAWAGIVAGFDQPPAEDGPRWPALEDLDPADGPSPSGAAPTSGLPTVGSGPSREPSSGQPAARRDDDHYRPPPPPPLPNLDPVSRLAWTAALGGPALLLVATLAGISLQGWVGALAVAAFMAGFVTLVVRMKERPPTDEGPDDGAVV